MIHSTFAKLSLVTLGLGAALAASAQVVAFSTKPAGGHYLAEPGSGGFGYGYDSPRFDIVAFRFSPTISGTFDSIDIAITNALGYGVGPNTFSVELHDNASDDTIGTLLGTAFSGVTTGTSSDDDYYSRVVGTGVSLTAGTDYWIVTHLQPNEEWNDSDGDTSLPGYRHNTQVPQDTRYLDQADGAFSIQVIPNPVPEPATFAALGVGAVSLLRRRRKA